MCQFHNKLQSYKKDFSYQLSDVRFFETEDLSNNILPIKMRCQRCDCFLTFTTERNASDAMRG